MCGIVAALSTRGPLAPDVLRSALDALFHRGPDGEGTAQLAGGAVAPFVQLDAARGGAGAGLGLAIAQRFAEAGRGRLELGTALEGGLLATLLLPRQGA